MVDSISVDYCFFGENDERAKPVLVMRNHKHRWVEATPMVNKGVNRWAAKSLADAIRRLGIKKFLFQSTDESILALKSKVIEELGAEYEVLPESSPVEDHQANGVTERSVQTIGGMLRAHKVALEDSLKEPLAPDSPAIPWLIQSGGGPSHRSSSAAQTAGRHTSVSWASRGAWRSRASGRRSPL